MAAKYPHMKQHEGEIWERFLKRIPWTPVTIKYDVRLGEGVPVAPETPEWVARMAWALSTKRVDVMVETRNEWIIVEVKQRAGLSAVGQLLGYLSLFVRQFRPAKSIRMVLVCERVAPDMGPILSEYGIETYLV